MPWLPVVFQYHRKWGNIKLTLVYHFSFLDLLLAEILYDPSYWNCDSVISSYFLLETLRLKESKNNIIYMINLWNWYISCIIEVVHIQCFKLFKGVEYTVLSMVMCTITNNWSHSIRVGHRPDFRLPSVATLPWLCRKRRKAIFTHSLTAQIMIVFELEKM